MININCNKIEKKWSQQPQLQTVDQTTKILALSGNPLREYLINASELYNDNLFQTLAVIEMEDLDRLDLEDGVYILYGGLDGLLLITNNYTNSTLTSVSQSLILASGILSRLINISLQQTWSTWTTLNQNQDLLNLLNNKLSITPQSLTDEQKAQIKLNLGIVDATNNITTKDIAQDALINTKISFTAQTLTDAQKAQARANIGISVNGSNDNSLVITNFNQLNRVDLVNGIYSITGSNDGLLFVQRQDDSVLQIYIGSSTILQRRIQITNPQVYSDWYNKNELQDILIEDKVSLSEQTLTTAQKNQVKLNLGITSSPTNSTLIVSAVAPLNAPEGTKWFSLTTGEEFNMINGIWITD